MVLHRAADLSVEHVFQHATEGEAAPVSGVCLTPDSKTLYVAAGLSVRVWDLASREQLQTLEPKHSHSLRSLDLSVDGRRLLTFDGDDLKLWDTQSLQPSGSLSHPNQVRSACF